MNKLKNFKKEEKEKGFIQAIILVIVALLLMQYFGITLTGVYYWLKDLVYSIL